MSKNHIKIIAKVWKYPGKAGWYFVTLPKRKSIEIEKIFGEFKRGWGSLKVHVTVGKTKWKTSIFPDRKIGSYLLPIKSIIREKEGIKINDRITLLLQIKWW